MTNNFDIIRTYMENEGIPAAEGKMGDLFFVIMLIRRGKDHPGLPAANYTFKTYYVDSLEKYDKIKDEIIKCCEMFKLRAYISINIKSKEKFSQMCAFKFTQNILNNEYKKPWAVIDHVFGKLTAKNEDRWIIDVDNVKPSVPEHPEDIDPKLLGIYMAIRKCESRYEDPVIMEIPTRSGVHIITHPFNLKRFKDECSARYEVIDEIPEAKKNHITLLYENIC